MGELQPSLRALLEQELVVAPGVLEPFTARLIQSLGYKALYLAGNAMGLHLCAGQPLLTLTETIDCTRRVMDATSVPLIVDAGAGFGGPIHVHRCIREFEKTGAAAIHIDDQPYPKLAAYHLGRGSLASVADARYRLATAVAARRSDTLMIFARTDALRVSGSMEHTLERCRAYVQAGVDGLMILNLAPDMVRMVRAEFPSTPLAWFASPSDTPPTSQKLQAAGFNMALYPFDTAAVVAEAVLGMWTDYLQTGRPAHDLCPLSKTAPKVQQIIGMQKYWDIEERTRLDDAERQD